MVLVIVFDRIVRKKCRCWRICEEAKSSGTYSIFF